MGRADLQANKIRPRVIERLKRLESGQGYTVNDLAQLLGFNKSVMRSRVYDMRDEGLLTNLGHGYSPIGSKKGVLWGLTKNNG
jgi:predicted transcriptional regulator